MCRFEATNIYATMNEVERVLAIKDGDHQAFINLYNEYWSQVYDFIGCILLQLLMQRKLFRMCL